MVRFGERRHVKGEMRAWQQEMKRCSRAYVVFRPESATVGIDDRPADRKAETETMLLRCHEWLEDRLEGISGNTSSAI